MVRRRDVAWDAAALAAVKLAVSLAVLLAGFRQVSDDDYARVVISQQFAHAPRLDPSGTSWLPFPFWVEGTAMMLAGRTLGVARGLAVALGCAVVAVPYVAMRSAGVRRGSAVAASVVALALPWNAWLGAATVPEGWSGALVAGALIAAGLPAVHGWAALALLAASLSRYEVWPASVVFAGACYVKARRGGEARGSAIAAAAVAMAGPAAWMAWNAHAHGSAVHFLARVAAFRHAVGAADVPITAKLLGYPLALFAEAPEAGLLGLVGAVGLARRDLRSRWLIPALAAGATLAFLVWGDLHDGAPTHHPARALVALWWIFSGMGADAVGEAVSSQAPRRALLGASAVAVAWCVTLPWRWARAPGESTMERREAQIARGEAMRSTSATRARVVPCAFEHFALLAAWGAPERATVLPATHQPVTADCPAVTVE